MIKNTCPHCGTSFSRPLDRGVAKPFATSIANRRPRLPSGPLQTGLHAYYLAEYEGETTRVGVQGAEAYRVDAYACPKCGELTIDLVHFRRGEDHKDVLLEVLPIKPSEKERPVATEVPAAIAEDYRDATRIAPLSLKGSATLARRCLQATLRHAYPDLPKKLDLFEEIQWVTENTDLPSEVKDALHALRKAGNFGAHPPLDGMTPVFELSKEDLEGCFVLLDTLFELLYVTPARKKASLSSLVNRMFPKKPSGESS